LTRKKDWSKRDPTKKEHRKSLGGLVIVVKPHGIEKKKGSYGDRRGVESVEDCTPGGKSRGGPGETGGLDVSSTGLPNMRNVWVTYNCTTMFTIHPSQKKDKKRCTRLKEKNKQNHGNVCEKDRKDA